MTDNVFDQLLFGWAYKGGIRAVRWSGGLSEDGAEAWNARLDKYCRLSPTPINHQQWRPEQAFSYLEFSDGKAAMLARFDSGDPARNTSHALVGQASTLHRYAMFLSKWTGWRASVVPVGQVHTDDWRDLASGSMDDARLNLSQNRPALTSLVRGVLCSKDTYFTLLVHTNPMPLLSLARGILDPLLSEPGKRFAWTYSTYESSDTDAEFSPQTDGAPNFLCIRSLPSSGETGRLRIDLGEEAEEDSLANLSSELITRYLKDPRQYRDAVGRDLTGVHGKDQRVVRLLQLYQVVPVGGPRQAASDGPTETMRRVDLDGVQTGPPPGDPDINSQQSQPQVPLQPSGPHEPPATTQPTSSTQPHLEPTQPAPPPDPGQHGRSQLKRERRRTADNLLATLKNGQEIPRDEYDRCVAELDALWKEDNPYMLLRQNKLERDVKNLMVGVIVTGAVLLLLVLLSLITRPGEAAAPQPSVLTVTVTESPSANQPGQPLVTTTSAVVKAPAVGGAHGATSQKQR